MIAYLDGRRGVSGSSLLSALIDAGADAERIAASLGVLIGGELDLGVEETIVDGLRARRLRLRGGDARLAEGPSEILTKIAGGGLPASVREQAADAYQRLARAEARVHGTTPETVRFEELGTLRSIVGVVGSAVAVDLLGIDRVAASSLPFGGGAMITHHGRLPLPAPATLELLRGMPVEPSDVDGELVTPTGAALVASLASSFGKIPAMTIQTVGIGSANEMLITRVVVGTPLLTAPAAG